MLKPSADQMRRLSNLSTDARLRAATDLVRELRCGVSAVHRLLSARERDHIPHAPARELQPGHRPGPPVMLLHGLGADSSALAPMERRLHRAGFTVHNVGYSCLGTDVERCAASVVEEAAWLLRETGSEQLHVVAHSLGGVVLRWAVTHTRMRDWVGLAVTLGSPHRGTPTALLAPPGLPGFGTIIRQLRPGLLDFADGGGGPDTVRWVTISGERDWVVPPRYATLPDLRNVRSVVLPGVGHMTLTTSSRCAAIVLEELAAATGTLTCHSAA